MPYYYFEAVAADGHVRKKILKARDKKDADQRLRNSGLHPILIESARIARKKKQERYIKRRIVRNMLLLVICISLVGGVATYLIVLDLTTVDRFDVQMLSRSGIIAQTSSIINAKTQEERDFAREIYGLWDMSFPDTVSGIEIKHKGLMLLYVKSGRERFRKNDLHLMASTLTRAFRRRFDTSTCIVQIVHDGDTLAEGEFRSGKVETFVD